MESTARIAYEMSRSEALRAFLERRGFLFSDQGPPRLQWEDLRRAGLAGEALNIYRRLGGVHDRPPVHPGAWNIACGDLVIELDEEWHFNRYRAFTLDSPSYVKMNFPVALYQDYCTRFEPQCIEAASTGGWWATPSSQFAFGDGDPPGVLGSLGPPRWRQRAFNDWIKDKSSLLTRVAVCRIAIWDQVENSGMSQDVGTVLRLFGTPAGRPLEELWGDALLDLIQSRAQGG
jgi:hypothetical protein